MPQGHRKVKIPDVLKKKLQKKGDGSAFTRRSNAPIQKKKSKFTEHDKIKQAISRKVNKSAEDELRSLSTEGKLNLSKTQKAIKKIQEETSENVKTEKITKMET